MNSIITCVPIKIKNTFMLIVIYFRERTATSFLKVWRYFPSMCSLINGVFLTQEGEAVGGGILQLLVTDRDTPQNGLPSLHIVSGMRTELSHWPRRTSVRILPAEEERQASASAKNPGEKFQSLISVTSTAHVYNTSSFQDWSDSSPKNEDWHHLLSSCCIGKHRKMLGRFF